MGNQGSSNGNSSSDKGGTRKEIFVYVFKEEFYESHVDALVCYIDTKWSQDDSFNKDLIEKGGNQFVSKYQTLLDRYRGNCQIGDVFPCHGGKLPCKKVFFCVVPNQMDSGQADAGGDINETLAAIFERVLEASASSGFHSLALPFGIGDLCPHPSVAIPMVYMRLLTLQNSSVMNIHLVTFDSGIKDLMEKVLTECHQSVPIKCQEVEPQKTDGQEETKPQIPDESHLDENGNGEKDENKTEEDLISQSDSEDEESDDESDEELHNDFNQNHQAETDTEFKSSQRLDEMAQQQTQTMLSYDTDSFEQTQQSMSPSKSSESLVDPDIEEQGAVALKLPLDDEEDDEEDDDDCQKFREQHLLIPWDGVCKKGSLIQKGVTFSTEVTERYLGEEDEVLVEFKRSESLSSIENEPLDFDNFRSKENRTSASTVLQNPTVDDTAVVCAEESFACPICLQQYPMRFQKKLDKCKHIFCRDCINQHLSVKRCCPICNVSYGTRIGTQPLNALMSYRVVSGSLPGYDGSDTIVIEYDIPDGIQSDEHPNPGEPYKGTQRTAYLPNTPDGQRIHKLLQKAFDQRLVFTVGKSMTTGKENVVTWNDIHHKTNINGGQQRFGYPDPTYLRRVYDELQQKGVTEDVAEDD